MKPLFFCEKLADASFTAFLGERGSIENEVQVKLLKPVRLKTHWLAQVGLVLPFQVFWEFYWSWEVTKYYYIESLIWSWAIRQI